MDTTDDMLDTDYDTAFGEATGDTPVNSTPGTDVPDDAEADNDANTDTSTDTNTGEETDGGDGAADTRDGAADDKDEGAEPTTPPAQPEAPKAVEQPQQPQPALDPKYLAAAMAEYQKTQAAEQVAPKQPEVPKEFTPEDFLDDNQKAALAVFDSEWSEVKAPVTALIQAHVQAALANQERALLSQMHQSLAPIQQVTARSQEAMHYATIQAAHPDFREKIPEVQAWIASQPSLTKAAFERAFQGGTAAEVVELYDVFKQAKGMTGAAPAQPASSAAQVPPQKSVPKAALNATLAPPTAQRSTPVNSRDPNDFEGAFDEAVSGR